MLGDDPGWQAILADAPAGGERPIWRPVGLVAYGTDARLGGTTDASSVTPELALGGTGRLELRSAFRESITDGSVVVSDAIALERRSVCAIAVAANAGGTVDRAHHLGRRGERIALEIGPYRIVGSLERGPGDDRGEDPGDGIGRPIVAVAVLTDAYVEWTVDGIAVRECHGELAVNLELARWVAPARDSAEEAIAFPSLRTLPEPTPASVRIAAGRASPGLVADGAV